MHARVKIAHSQSGTQQEATNLLRDLMLPKARELTQDWAFLGEE